MDSDESIRSSVGQYLYDSGYRVTACPDPHSALRVMDDTRANPDAIITDVNRVDSEASDTNMNGLEFLRLIRTNDARVEIPVVVCSSRVTTNDRIAGYEAGADAYLPKTQQQPLSSNEELLAVVDNVIQRHEILNGAQVQLTELLSDVSDIQQSLLESGGFRGGVGNGWIKASASDVFLRPDEKTVLGYLCQGMTNEEIAENVRFSKSRVRQHLTSMFRKVKVTNRTALVRWAISAGYSS